MAVCQRQVRPCPLHAPLVLIIDFLTPPPISRFDAGFNKGWDDAGNGQNDEVAATEAHKEQVGDHPREWQFTRASSLSPPSPSFRASLADGLPPPPPFLSR